MKRISEDEHISCIAFHKLNDCRCEELEERDKEMNSIIYNQCEHIKVTDKRNKELEKIIKQLIQLRPNDAVLDNLLILELDKDGLVNLYQLLADEALQSKEGCEWKRKGNEWITSCGDRCDGFAIMESKNCWKCGKPIKETR